MTNISEAARAAQREYKREWRKKNKERVRESNRRYWEKKAAEMANKEVRYDNI